jgi:hypothetical protein
MASGAARLLRAYATQVEALRRLRNGGSQTETDEPGANDAATISRFSASGHDRLRFPVPFVPITEFVDTACPHNKNDHIRLRETKRFGKAVLGGGRRKVAAQR